MRALYLPMASALLLAHASLAQNNQPAPELSLVTIYKIKPDMRAEFEAGQKELSAAYRKAEVPSRMVMQTVLGDLLGYVSVTPLSKFADMDGTSPVVRALGQEEAARLLRRVGATFTSAQRLVSVDRPDLSIMTSNEQPGETALVIGITAAPGRMMDLEAIMKGELMAACKKAGVKHMWVSDVIFGGEGGMKVVVVPVEKMAAFDLKSPMERALGAEGARKLEAKMSTTIAHEEFSVLRMRPDLSHVPQPRAAARP